jgi:hypothetical protein
MQLSTTELGEGRGVLTFRVPNPKAREQLEHGLRRRNRIVGLTDLGRPVLPPEVEIRWGDARGTTLVRAVMKVLFNYLAYRLGPTVVGARSFGPLRRAIMTGKGVGRFAISIPPAFAGAEEVDMRTIGALHQLLVVAARGVGVRGVLLLFSSFPFVVRLASTWNQEPLRLEHVFDGRRRRDHQLA